MRNKTFFKSAELHVFKTYGLINLPVSFVEYNAYILRMVS